MQTQYNGEDQLHGMKVLCMGSTTANSCVRQRQFHLTLYRSLDRDIHQQLFFHRSEVQMEPGQAIIPGAEVSFSLAPDTQGKGEGNPMAVHVQLLPEGILEAEKRLPGSLCYWCYA